MAVPRVVAAAARSSPRWGGDDDTDEPVSGGGDEVRTMRWQLQQLVRCNLSAARFCAPDGDEAAGGSGASVEVLSNTPTCAERGRSGSSSSTSHSSHSSQSSSPKAGGGAETVVCVDVRGAALSTADGDLSFGWTSDLVRGLSPHAPPPPAAGGDHDPAASPAPPPASPPHTPPTPPTARSTAAESVVRTFVNMRDVMLHHHPAGTSDAADAPSSHGSSKGGAADSSTPSSSTHSSAAPPPASAPSEPCAAAMLTAAKLSVECVSVCSAAGAQSTTTSVHASDLALFVSLTPRSDRPLPASRAALPAAGFTRVARERQVRVGVTAGGAAGACRVELSNQELALHTGRETFHSLTQVLAACVPLPPDDCYPPDIPPPPSPRGAGVTPPESTPSPGAALTQPGLVEAALGGPGLVPPRAGMHGSGRWDAVLVERPSASARGGADFAYFAG